MLYQVRWVMELIYNQDAINSTLLAIIMLNLVAEKTPKILYPLLHISDRNFIFSKTLKPSW
jgi:hypothetical protein